MAINNNNVLVGSFGDYSAAIKGGAAFVYVIDGNEPSIVSFFK